MYLDQVIEVLKLLIGVTDEKLRWALVALLNYALKHNEYPLFELREFDILASQANVYYEVTASNGTPDWRDSSEMRTMRVQITSVACEDYVQPREMKILDAHMHLEDVIEVAVNG